MIGVKSELNVPGHSSNSVLHLTWSSPDPSPTKHRSGSRWKHAATEHIPTGSMLNRSLCISQCRQPQKENEKKNTLFHMMHCTQEIEKRSSNSKRFFRWQKVLALKKIVGFAHSHESEAAATAQNTVEIFYLS